VECVVANHAFISVIILIALAQNNPHRSSYSTLTLVSHAIKSRPRRLVKRVSRALVVILLLDGAIIGVEAIRKVLGVFVGGVLGEQNARGSGLEGLEARLALDGLCADVLHTCE
jgi:hypothetical protein